MAKVDHSADFVVEEDGPQADPGASIAQRQPALAEAATAQSLTAWHTAKAQEERQRLAQRQKQVDFGKNTIAYQRYIQQVPREKRRMRDPATPDVHKDISKRNFDGQVKAWRRALHAWDEGRLASRPQRHGQAQPASKGHEQPDEEQAPPSSRLSGSSSDGSDRSSSQGSLDGYLQPKASHASRKRALEEPLHEKASNDPRAYKYQSREASKGSMAEDPFKAELAISTKFKSTEGEPSTAPTSFPTSNKVTVSQPLGTTGQGTPEADVPYQDNVIAMILGNDSRSAMSWASEDKPVL